MWIEVNPWSDKGWVLGHVELSPCCGAAIQASLADGVLAGSCAKCGAWVARVNPKTGMLEKQAQMEGEN